MKALLMLCIHHYFSLPVLALLNLPSSRMRYKDN